MAQKQQKQGKKGKRQRIHKYTDPTNAARRNVDSEINKTEKKTAKLLRLRDENRKRSNSFRVIRDEEGKEIKRITITRYQGMERDGKRHLALKKHLQGLKKRKRQLEKEHKADTYKKATSL